MIGNEKNSKKRVNNKISTAISFDRTYRSGMKLMEEAYSPKAKSNGLNPVQVSAWTDEYLASGAELDWAIASSIGNNDPEPWQVFVQAYKGLADEEKPLFRGVIQDIRKTAEHVLGGAPNPIQDIVDNPYFPTTYNPDITFPEWNKELWKQVHADTEGMMAMNKYGHEDIDSVGEVIAGVGGGMSLAGNPAGAAVMAAGAVIVGANSAAEAVANWWYGN